MGNYEDLAREEKKEATMIFVKVTVVTGKEYAGLADSNAVKTLERYGHLANFLRVEDGGKATDINPMYIVTVHHV